MKNLFKGIIIGLLLVSGISYASSVLRFVQTPTTSLYTNLSTTATTMRITPYPTDLDGNKLTMQDFGSTTAVTIDPKVKKIEEIVTFTGITDNGDNTATLTGLTRDLISKYPYTTAGTGRQHGAGAIVVFSNNPQMYNRFYALENVSTSTNTLIFSSTTPPYYDSVSKQAGGTYISTTSEFASIAYVNATGAGVNVNATQSVKGISQLATAIQQASSTISGSTGAGLVTQAQDASSSPTIGCDGTAVAGALCSVIARNNGTINPNYIATSTTDNYNFNGIVTSSATTTLSGFNNTIASSTAYTINVGSLNATSTLLLNGVRLATTTTLFAGYNTVAAGGTGATTTSLFLTIPANTLNVNDTLDSKVAFNYAVPTNGESCGVDFGTGAATTSITYGVQGQPQTALAQTFMIVATSTSAEFVTSMSNDSVNNNGFSPITSFRQGNFFTNYSTTAVLYLDFRCNGNSPATGKVTGGYVTIIK